VAVNTLISHRLDVVTPFQHASGLLCSEGVGRTASQHMQVVQRRRSAGALPP
jgi:hypothetical protein